MTFLKDLSTLPEALSLNYVTKCNNLCLFLDYIINLTIKFLLLGIKFASCGFEYGKLCISLLKEESNSNPVNF